MEHSGKDSELPFEVEREVNAILNSFSYDAASKDEGDGPSEFGEYDEAEESDNVEDDQEDREEASNEEQEEKVKSEAECQPQHPAMDMDLEDAFDLRFRHAPGPSPALPKDRQDTTSLLNSEEDLLDDDEFIYNIKRRRKGKRGRRPKKDYGLGKSSTPFLPKHIGKLMGQANVAYVTKQYDSAILLYKEVVRQAPQAHEAYAILSIIYQELGDEKKSFNYSLLHLHLSGGDNESWHNLAEQAVSLKLFNEAIYCYTKAIKKNKKDMNSCWRRSLIFYKHRHFKRLTDSYSFILHCMPFQPFITRLLVHFHLISNEPLRAIQALEESLLIAPSASAVARLYHVWQFFHLRILLRLYRYIGDHQRVVGATPNIVLWMRKMKMARIQASSTPRPPSPTTALDEEKLTETGSVHLLDHDFGVPEDCDLLAAINTLRGPLDAVLDPTRAHDMMFGFRDSVSSDADAALGPFVETDAENEIVMAPLEHLSAWFEWLPVDLKGYFICSAIVCGLLESAISLHSMLRSTVEPDIWSGLGIEMGKLLIEASYLEEAVRFFSFLVHQVFGKHHQVVIFSYMARCQRLQGRIRESLELYLRAYGLDCDNDEVNMGLAETYASLGQTELSQSHAIKVASMHSGALPGSQARSSSLEPSARPISEHIISILSGSQEPSTSVEDAESLSDLPSGSMPSGSNNCIVVASGRVRKTDRRPRRQRAVAADVNSRLTRSSASQQANGELRFAPFEFPFERRLEYLRYAEPQCKQLRLLYKKCILLYREDSADRSLMSSFVDPTGCLIVDFLNNGYFYRESHSELKPFSSQLKEVRKQLLSSTVSQDPEIFTIMHALAQEAKDEHVDQSGMRQALMQASHGLTFQEWFDMVFKFALASAHLNKYEQAVYVLFKASSSNIFYHRSQYKLRLYLLILAIAQKGGLMKAVSKICRLLLFEYQTWDQVYALVAYFFASGIKAVEGIADGSNLKFFLRENSRYPNSIPRLLLTGHSYLASRSYPDALTTYLKAYRLDPSQPLTLLLIAICYLNRAVQRVTPNRQFQILEGLAFMHEYQRARGGESQETCYNLGRYFDHLGLASEAVIFYEKALSINTTDTSQDSSGPDDDLRFETAYNLSLLYKRSGNYVLASHYMHAYCRI